MIVSKFADHTPFYRQAKIYARQGIRLDRATLGNWSGRACFHPQPVADHMRRHLAAADRLFMDETTAPVLDPGRGQTKRGYFWAVAPTTAATAAQVRRSCCSNMPPVAAARSLSSSWTALTDAYCNVMPMTVMTG